MTHLNKTCSQVLSVFFGVILFSGSVLLSFAEVNGTDSTINSTGMIPTSILTQTIKTIPSPQNSILIENATVTSDSIEIGQDVTWTQTVKLNGTAENIALEIPDDAQIKQIMIADGTDSVNVMEPSGLDQEISIIPSEQTKVILEQSFASNGTAVIDGAESLLVNLDKIASTEENEDTKLVIVSEKTEEVSIQYETPAPYAIEKETYGNESYEKKVKVKSDSAIHYENVRSYSAIPEEYVLQGIPFELDWLVNGTRVNVIDDERFDVQFSDTDGNGLIDTMSWVVLQLSEKVFSINADTGEADEIDDVPSKLELMQQKLDGPFYGKTLKMVNAKVADKLDEYLADKRETDIKEIDDEYYHIVVLVPKSDSKSIDYKEKTSNELKEKFDARNIYKTTHLSFVSAQIPVSKISQLVEYDELHMISDGEMPADMRMEILGAIEI